MTRNNGPVLVIASALFSTIMMTVTQSLQPDSVLTKVSVGNHVTVAEFIQNAAGDATEVTNILGVVATTQMIYHGAVLMTATGTEEGCFVTFGLNVGYAKDCNNPPSGSVPIFD